jgi:hypothetical protein
MHARQKALHHPWGNDLNTAKPCDLSRIEQI